MAAIVADEAIWQFFISALSSGDDVVADDDDDGGDDYDVYRVSIGIFEKSY